MALDTTQLNAIIAHALPGERLKDARELPDGRYALAFAGGERLELRLYDAASDAANASAALQRLRGEIDLPIAQERAADLNGDSIGQPYMITSMLPGEPLAQVIDRMSGEALYAVGRQLGETISRVHGLTTLSYGDLADGASSAASDERGYVLERVTQDLARSQAHGLLDQDTSAALHAWFATQFHSASPRIALLHGDLRPETILVRQTSATWRLSGLIGWEWALGWVPAWEHVVLLDATSDARYFGLRVGYGNGYDEQTQRTYEQVRERVLIPYRLLLAIARLPNVYASGDEASAQHYQRMIEGALRLLDGDEARDTTASYT